MNASNVFQSIFHPTDFSPDGEGAFAHALKLALTAKAELRVIHYAEYAETAVDLHGNCFPKVKEILVRWQILAPDSPQVDLDKLGMRMEGIIASGPDKFSSLVQQLNQNVPDILVLATHQLEGLSRWLHQPIAEPLARQAGCPTLFVPPESNGWVSLEDGSVNLERILIPITHLIPPQSAIDHAVDLTRLLAVNRIEWKIFHVGEKEEMPAVYLPTQEGWQWEKRARPGQLVEQILEMAEEFSPHLMVMMTEGHHGLFDILLGSTTERVLRGVRCPVLAIPFSHEG